jgi:hypothetical protein
MARGWESKSVESQIEEREARHASSTVIDPAVVERKRQRESLQLSRTRILNDLERAQHPQHRATLQAALSHLDDKLAELA